MWGKNVWTHLILIFIMMKCVYLSTVKCVYFSQQTSLSCDTDTALCNMKQIGEVVREDHQSLVSHVCKHVFHIFDISCMLLCNYQVTMNELMCNFPVLFSTVR